MIHSILTQGSGSGTLGLRDPLLDQGQRQHRHHYGTGAPCTGTAALAAANPSW